MRKYGGPETRRGDVRGRAAERASLSVGRSPARRGRDLRGPHALDELIDLRGERRTPETPGDGAGLLEDLETRLALPPFQVEAPDVDEGPGVVRQAADFF